MEREKFDKLYEKSLNTSGSDKLWNYFLDVIKTEKFQRLIKKYKEAFCKNEEIFLYDKYIAPTLINDYGLDAYDWEETINTYTFENKLEKPEGVGMCKVLSIGDVAESLEEKVGVEKFLMKNRPLLDLNTKNNLMKNYPIVILVHRNSSSRDILDFVKNNYTLNIKNYIDIIFNKDKKDDSLSAGKSRKKNKKIIERNNFIYENRHLCRSDIAKLVRISFGEHIDVGYIGKIISNENKKRK